MYLPLYFDQNVCPPLGLSWQNERPSQKRLYLLADLLTSSIASIAFNCFLDCFFTFRLRLALRWSLKTFPKSAWLCFCRNFVFSLRSIEATCDGEVPVTPNNTFFLLSYIIVLLHILINNTVLPKNSRTVSICTVLGLPLHLFNHNPQFW